jgi:hypothetical protein
VHGLRPVGAAEPSLMFHVPRRWKSDLPRSLKSCQTLEDSVAIIVGKSLQPRRQC